MYRLKSHMHPNPEKVKQNLIGSGTVYRFPKGGIMLVGHFEMHGQKKDVKTSSDYNLYMK